MVNANRLRVIGTIVLVCGLAGAYLFYWRETRSAVPTIDDLLPGYSEKRARQTAIVMGNLVVTLLGWADALKEPSTQALIMAGASVLVAFGCFRIASLLDQPADESHAPRPREG
jgi:hypothetical protein